jgi:AbrB family looped-hinge helix DNA binding protein
VKVTQKGQVTIPVHVRRRLGITSGSEVEFALEGDRVVLRKPAVAQQRGRQIVTRLKGRATVRMSTDEIMALTRGDA